MSGRIKNALVASHARVTRRQFVDGTCDLAGGIIADGLILSAAWAAPPNQKVDLTALPINTTTKVNYISPVKNQHTCNACTAFAVVAAIEGAYNRTKNPNDNDQDLNLSEGQL